MSDAEKHAWCKKRNGFGAVFLPRALYLAAEAEGWDMRWYVIQKLIPVPD